MSTSVIIYARVSTEMQSEEGVSLAAQVAKCTAYAIAKDYRVVEVIQETGSAKGVIGRPLFQGAITAIQSRRVDGLLVAKLDRMTRSLRDLGTLLETTFHANGGQLMSVSDNIDTRTATGRMLLNVLMSVSQWEREVISERTKEAIMHQKRGNAYFGGHPAYGHGSRGGDEQPILSAIADMHRVGLTVSDIVRTLNEKGMRNRAGKPFQRTTVARIVAQCKIAA